MSESHRLPFFQNLSHPFLFFSQKVWFHGLNQGSWSYSNRQSESSYVLVKIIYLHSKTHFNKFSTKIQSQDSIVKFVKMCKIFLCHFSSWSFILAHHSKLINHKKNDEIGIYLEFYFCEKLKF